MYLLSGADEAHSRLSRIARHQHGPFTRHQAVSAGFSDRTIDRLVAAGHWMPLHPGVYTYAGTPRSLELREQGALLAAGPEAVLAGFNAAHHWHLWRRPPYIEILVERRRGPEPAGVVVHTTRQLEPGDVVEDGNRRVLAPHRVPVELACRVPERQLRILLDDGVRLGLFTAADVYERAMRAHGRGGMKRLRRLAATVPDSTTCHESRLENEFARICQDHVVPAPEHHRLVTTPAGTFEADFAWPEVGLVVETDGPHHSRSEQRSFDRCRDADLAEVEYDTIRLRLDDILNHPDRVGPRIRREWEKRRDRRRGVPGSSADRWR